MSDATCYMCVLCGYIYDPEVGDPIQGVMPGTEFAAVDENWQCPLCYADKSEFEPV